MTLAEARKLLESDAYFVVLIPWDHIKGSLEQTIERKLTGSYTPDEYEVVEPEGSDVLYSYARTMARSQAEREGATFWISDRARSHIVMILRKPTSRRYECVLRIIKVKNPRPLEPEKFPLKSFDPAETN